VHVAVHGCSFLLLPEFPTTKLEMTAVADIFDRDGDGYIDYYEFVAALHPNKDAYRPTTAADKIEDEVKHWDGLGWVRTGVAGEWGTRRKERTVLVLSQRNASVYHHCVGTVGV